MRTLYRNDAIDFELEDYYYEIEQDDGMFYYGGGNGFGALYGAYLYTTMEVIGVFPDDGVICCEGEFTRSTRTYSFSLTIYDMFADDLSEIERGDMITVCYNIQSYRIDCWSVLYEGSAYGTGFVVDD